MWFDQLFNSRYSFAYIDIIDIDNYFLDGCDFVELF